MAKEYYDVSYKTYFNDRIKPLVFRGRETHPLYVQVTYDRRSIFFKSYYFEVFARPKYDFLKTNILQINDLESRMVDYLINRDAERFELDGLLGQYKLFSTDVLDSFDGSFKIWLGAFLKGEGFPGLAFFIETAPDGVAAIQLWDELKKSLQPDIFDKMEEAVVRDGHPYIPLATYIRGKFPKGPFCLPLYEWAREEKQAEIEEYLADVFWGLDMGRVTRAVAKVLYPKGLMV